MTSWLSYFPSRVRYYKMSQPNPQRAHLVICGEKPSANLLFCDSPPPTLPLIRRSCPLSHRILTLTFFFSSGFSKLQSLVQREPPSDALQVTEHLLADNPASCHSDDKKPYLPPRLKGDHWALRPRKERLSGSTQL